MRHLQTVTDKAGGHNYYCGDMFDQSSGSLVTSESILAVSRPNLGIITQVTTAIGAKEELENLRRQMGFNISELAKIMKVKRPTIYEWLDSKDPNPKNQARLGLIYSFCERWHELEPGRLGPYKYKKMLHSKCLIDLLAEEKINKQGIMNLLNMIAKHLLRAIEKRAASDALRHSEGFDPMSKEQKIAALKKFARSIS